MAILDIFIAVTVALVLFLLFYVYARYTYAIEPEKIFIKRYLLYFIPYGCLRIKYKNIKNIHAYNGMFDVVGADIWGVLFRKRAIIIRLKKGLIRKYFITPDNTTEFLEQVKSRIL